jgi:hypothetical protein
MKHPEPHDLTALAYDLLEEPERVSLLEHLADCDACRDAYDALRLEQADVREAVLHDMRNGPVETRALERALAMLRGEAPARARRRPPLLRWGLEAAAVLAVGAGLLLLLAPGTDDAGAPAPLTIAAERQVPAVLESGRVLVSDGQAWRPADAVPVDEWVMASRDSLEPLRLNFHSQQASAEFTPGSVFRVALAEAGPRVFMLHGAGTLDARGRLEDTLLSSGDVHFYNFMNSSLTLHAVAEGGTPQPVALRSWSRPRSVEASVSGGEVLVIPQGPQAAILALRGGERVQLEHGRLIVSQMLAAERAREALNTARQTLEDQQARLSHVQGLIRELPHGVKADAELRLARMIARPAVGEDVALFWPPRIRTAQEGLSLDLSRRGDILVAILTRRGEAVERFEAESLEALQAMVPEYARDLITNTD